MICKLYSFDFICTLYTSKLLLGYNLKAQFEGIKIAIASEIPLNKPSVCSGIYTNIPDIFFKHFYAIIFKEERRPGK